METISLLAINSLNGGGADPRVDGILQKIPNQATAENKLADKAFVNSSIATNTAYFRGTFESVAELEAYSGEKTPNDYAFVIVYDPVVTTEVKQYDRYKLNEDLEWDFEYTLNNSSFTAEQWAAISSGITSGLVALISTALQISDYEVKNMVVTYDDDMTETFKILVEKETS